MEHAFPTHPRPGQVELGPDGTPHVFADGAWTPDLTDPWAPQPPAPVERAALPDLSGFDSMEDAVHYLQDSLLAHGAQRRQEDRPSLQQQIDARSARDRLERQLTRHDPDDLCADVYEGDYAAVIAETAPGQRRDGWTVERRLLFLERLAECGSVLAAARAAGVSRRSVYKLLPRAPAFAAALDEAMRTSNAVLADTLFDRAVHGHEVPIVHKGEVVATRTVHHDQLGCYLLRVRDPLNYAPVDEIDRWLHRRGTPAATRPLGNGQADRLAQLDGGPAGAAPQPPAPM